jgi:hypothetical protein
MRRAGVAFAALALLAAAAPAAQADHVHPTVTASLALGAKVNDCSPSRVCGGSRRATVSWNATCGPGVSPDALEEIEVSILGVKPSGRRFTFESETFDSVGAGLVDSVGMVAGPGLRFVGEVVVTCNVQAETPDGDLVDHRGTARGTTAEAFLPPRLGSFGIPRGTWCGVAVKGSGNFLQAGQFFDVQWGLRYSGASLFRSGVPARSQIKLFGRGAGIRFKRSPSLAILRNFYGIGTAVRPRRAGTLKIWATIGGKKTNTLRIRVAPKRC